MSRRTQVPAGASLERFAISERDQLDDGTPAVVCMALWRGDYSQGYKSDYQRVETRWLVIEARHADTGKLLRWSETETWRGPRRVCSQFSGKRFAQALRDFETAATRDGMIENPGTANRYYHAIQAGRPMQMAAA